MPNICQNKFFDRNAIDLIKNIPCFQACVIYLTGRRTRAPTFNYSRTSIRGELSWPIGEFRNLDAQEQYALGLLYVTGQGMHIQYMYLCTYIHVVYICIPCTSKYVTTSHSGLTTRTSNNGGQAAYLEDTFRGVRF